MRRIVRWQTRKILLAVVLVLGVHGTAALSRQPDTSISPRWYKYISSVMYLTAATRSNRPGLSFGTAVPMALDARHLPS